MHLRNALGVFALTVVSTASLAQAAAHEAVPAHPQAARVSPYRSLARSHQAELDMSTVWGIEQLHVRKTSSGALIRFSYRVVDARKAKVLQLKQAEPHLIGLRSHAMLSVPSLENVGQLRQTESIENGKDYWVLFSDKGDLVKVGDRVDIVIGDFYASGLTVE